MGCFYPKSIKSYGYIRKKYIKRSRRTCFCGSFFCPYIPIS